MMFLLKYFLSRYLSKCFCVSQGIFFTIENLEISFYFCQKTNWLNKLATSFLKYKMDRVFLQFSLYSIINHTYPNDMHRKYVVIHLCFGNLTCTEVECNNFELHLIIFNHSILCINFKMLRYELADMNFVQNICHSNTDNIETIKEQERESKYKWWTEERLYIKGEKRKNI